MLHLPNKPSAWQLNSLVMLVILHHDNKSTWVTRIQESRLWRYSAFEWVRYEAIKLRVWELETHQWLFEVILPVVNVAFVFSSQLWSHWHVPLKFYWCEPPLGNWIMLSISYIQEHNPFSSELRKKDSVLGFFPECLVKVKNLFFRASIHQLCLSFTLTEKENGPVFQLAILWLP